MLRFTMCYNVREKVFVQHLVFLFFYGGEEKTKVDSLPFEQKILFSAFVIEKFVYDLVVVILKRLIGASCSICVSYQLHIIFKVLRTSSQLSVKAVAHEFGCDLVNRSLGYLLLELMWHNLDCHINILFSVSCGKWTSSMKVIGDVWWKHGKGRWHVLTSVDIIIQLHSVISQFFIIVMPFAQFYMFTSSRIILDSSRFICNMSHFPHISTASTRWTLSMQRLSCKFNEWIWDEVSHWQIVSATNLMENSWMWQILIYLLSRNYFT